MEGYSLGESKNAMKFKYIITEVMGTETPFIFPEWVNHKDVSKGWIGTPVAAGEVLFVGTETPADTCLVSNIIEVSCSGESVSLNLKSRYAVDAELIQRLFTRQWN